MDEGKLHTFVGQVLQDLGGAMSVPLVQIGESLGLYEALEKHGPCTSQAFAEATGLNERYMREWLYAQAASNYIDFDGDAGTFSLSPEQAFVLANRNSPFYLAPAFTTAATFGENRPLVEAAFKTGDGIAWGDQSQCLSCAVANFFRAGYKNHVVQEWLPSLTGALGKLEKGARVADVGCGHGLSTAFMAEAFPNSEFLGLDFHEPSIEAAKSHAAEKGLKNIDFQAKPAKDLDGSFDLVTIFDCLHDMGDPVGALKAVKSMLNEGGTCMIVEPMAGDHPKDNMNPVSRLFYNASTMVCVPTSLAQEVGAALGAQAGEAKIREVALEAGFTSLTRATETPFNLILEARC